MGRVPQIGAVKEFGGGVRRLKSIRERTSFDGTVGADEFMWEAMGEGATGWIAGLANVLPAASSQLCSAVRDQHRGKARFLSSVASTVSV
jgi:dihydrodipicolinate synthase/N-acetylneuraminate lyase